MCTDIMFLDIFLTSFSLVFLAELGDKTMLATVCLAAQYRRPRIVLLAAMAALTAATAIAVVLGALLNISLPTDILTIVSSLLFIVIGIHTIWANSDECETIPSQNSILGMFWLVFLSEMGDKTQLAAILIAAQTGLAFVVFCGAVLGLLLVNIIGAAIGAKLAENISLRKIKIAAGAAFVIIGVLILIGVF